MTRPQQSAAIRAGWMVASLSVAMPMTAHAADKPILHYYLTRTDLAVKLTAVLQSCPVAGQADAPVVPVIKEAWTIQPRTGPDHELPVKVDASAGLFADRTTALVLNADQTLAGFNAKTEGKGAAIFGGIVKLATTILPMAGVGPDGDPPPPPMLWCSGKAIETLTKLREVSSAIEALEAEVVKGTATPFTLEKMALLKQRKEVLKAFLTFEDTVILNPDCRASPGGDCSANPVATMAAGHKGAWFSKIKPSVDAAATGGDPISFVWHDFGGEGSAPRYTLMAKSLGTRTICKGAAECGVPTAATAKLFYRRPVPAQITATDMAAASGKSESVIETSSPVLVAQWGAVHSLSVGRGGLFGSRQAAAKFDASGAPIEISYGSTGGAADMASMLGSANEAAVSLRDAETASLEREIKKLELRKKLADLQSAE